jgi:hypothetical protein
VKSLPLMQPGRLLRGPQRLVMHKRLTLKPNSRRPDLLPLSNFLRESKLSADFDGRAGVDESG